MKSPLDLSEIDEMMKALGDEFVIIDNPNYIYASFEICPLAPKILKKRDTIVGVVQDMDGTTTTTENLCLYSLESMVRQITGRLTRESWAGLDRAVDYPHIIGNSTTKHVEYLVSTYRESIRSDHFCEAYLRAACMTLAVGKDEGRKQDVLDNLKYFGVAEPLNEQGIIDGLKSTHGTDRMDLLPEGVEDVIQDMASRIDLQREEDRVRAAIDIYYQTYHDILAKIDSNDSKGLAEHLPDTNKRWIEPMPGVGIFLATIRGWLGEDLHLSYGELKEELMTRSPDSFDEETLAQHRDRLRSLGLYCQHHPIKSAIVTSSIGFEANIVLSEVFSVLQEQISSWPIDGKKREMLRDRFSSPQNVFDVIITASDSSEIRLKPHRDLYSLALHRLGIPKTAYDNVIGFEDSESGTIAIRAAGVGLCVAVPFADTRGHRLDFASHVLAGGLPEGLLVHHLFLNDEVLKGYD